MQSEMVQRAVRLYDLHGRGYRKPHHFSLQEAAMKALLILAVLILAGLAGCRLLGQQPPLRGMLQDDAGQRVLISRARPAVIFAPADGMRLCASGWRSLAPESRTTEPGNARLWFATYENGTGLLITALAEAETPWRWEPAQHCPYPALRTLHYEQDGEMLYESLFCLTAEQDAFHAHDGQSCLVYRAAFLLDFRQMQVIAEYHEPLDPVLARDVAYDAARLNAFQDRARRACRILFPEKTAQAELKERIQKMDPADDAFSRTRLSRWVGEMQRRKDL